MSYLGRLLFPSPSRDFPGKRWVKILLRAVHVVCVAGLLGAFLFTTAAGETAAIGMAPDPSPVPDPECTGPWLHGSILSGLAILLLDLYTSAVFLCQVRGLVVVLKIAALLTLPLMGRFAAAVLIVLMLVSVVSSHASSGFRYFLIAGRGKLTPTQDKG